jgi:hypothetical protein
MHRSRVSTFLISGWQGCHTLEVPGGRLLCVIPVHSDAAYFTEHSTSSESA